MIKGIAHVAYLVSDMDQSITFYETMFGFHKKFELNHPNGEPWIVYIQVNKNQFIELFYGTKPFDQITHQSYQHLCLEVDDIFSFEAHVKKLGGTLSKPIILGLDHNYQCWLDDPDGNPIEIMQYGKHALQLLP